MGILSHTIAVVPDEAIAVIEKSLGQKKPAKKIEPAAVASSGKQQVQKRKKNSQ